MALAQTLMCKKREIGTKGSLNELRRKNWVPGVLYGKDQESLPILLTGKEISRVFSHSGSRGIFSLQIEGDTAPAMAMVKEIQRNPISGELTHVDFLSVKMNEKINSLVTIHLTGEEELIKKGGILQTISREIPIACFPGDIPETIVFDISDLNMGDKITAGDVPLPANVELLEEPDTVLFNILAPSKGTAEAEEEAKEEPPAE